MKKTNSVRGFSLIEVAIALAILGLVALAATAYWRSATQAKVVLVERDLMAQAQSTLVGFAYTQFRLPCPASNPTTGLEDCSATNQAQFLPWATLALGDTRLRQMRYGVYRKANVNPRLDTDLSTATSLDRAGVIITTGVSERTTPIGMDTLIGNRNLFDFCHALNTAASLATDSNFLHTIDTAGNKKNVAFALALPGGADADGDGNVFDGFQAAQYPAAPASPAGAPAFDAPSRPHTLDFDDKVAATSAGTLFASLSCGLAFAAADHTHFNAATTARIMQKGYYDYKFILELNVAIATVGSFGAIANVASAAAGVAAGIATLAGAIADASIYTAASILAIVASAIAFVAATVNFTAATIAAAAAATIVFAASAFLDRFTRERVPRIEALAQSVELNARDADRLGF